MKSKRKIITTPLRKERDERGWTVKELQVRLDKLMQDDINNGSKKEKEEEERDPISTRQIEAWERGEHLPHPYWRHLLCTVYKKSPIELGLVRNKSDEIATPKGRDWGEAPDVHVFFGRTKEIILLETWIVKDRCRLVALVGMKGIGKTRLSVKLGKGGIGKTDLSLKLAQGIQEHFDYVIWRRLLNAPKISEVLMDLIKFFSNQQEVQMPDTVNGQILQVLSYLRKSRCLVILDNVEMILQGGKSTDQYVPGYEEYSQFFEQIAEVPHQSCLLLTSREKIPEIAKLESETGPVRSLEVKGLHDSDGKKIFAEVGSFVGSKEDWQQLNWLYDGNPLALGLAARHIKEVFFGNIAEFLSEGKPIFADLQDLLDWHFNRLSDFHKEVMYWLAINREPTPLSELKEDTLSFISKEQISSTLQSLQRLIPLEKSAKSFTLQPVIIEYMTKRFIEQIVEEVHNEAISLFNTHTLFKTSVSDYVRDIQSRLILRPICEKLLGICRNQAMLEIKLKETLSLLRTKFHFTSGYAGGNILNMLCYLDVDIDRYDFSSLAIWHAYLQGRDLPNVNFAYANFLKSVFTDTFGIIFAIAFSPNGELLAAGTSNDEVQLWYTASGTPVLTCKGHTDQVWTVAFSPDGKILASGSEDQTVRLWDVDTGHCLHILQEQVGRIWSIAFSPNGPILAISSEDQITHLCIWKISREKCEKYIEMPREHTGKVSTVAFSPDGKILASGSEDQTVRLWDVDTGRCLNVLRGHTDRIYSIAFNPEGTILVSGSQDQIVRLWDVDTGRCLRILQGHTGWVRSVAFSPHGNTFASGGQDVQLWDVNTGHCLKNLQGHSSSVFALAFHPDGGILASGGQDQYLRLWEMSTGRCLKTLQSYTNSVYAVIFSPDGSTLASANRDQTVRLWDVNTGHCLKILRGHTDWVRAVSFSPDGKILASGSEDQSVRLWEVSTDYSSRVLRGHTDLLRSVAFSPDGRILASGSEDQTVRLWEVSTGYHLKTLQGHVDRVWSVDFSPDGNILASASDDQTVRLWEVTTGNCLQILQGHTDWIRSVAFSPDGNTIASGSQDQTVRLWEVTTGNCLQILQGHTDWVRSVAFSSDGNTIASGSQDQTVRLWETSTGDFLKSLPGHTDGVYSVAFSPKQDLLASGSDDATIKFWQAQTGQCLKTLRSDRPYEHMNITGVKGLTDAQKAILRVLGATEKNYTQEI